MTLLIKKSASYELRELFYNILTGDPTLTSREYTDEHDNTVYARVYDTVPPKVKKPYIAVGKAAIKIDREYQSKDMFVDLYMLEIDCFTHYGGKKQVAQLQNDAMYALSTAWANNLLQFEEDSPFLMGNLFEIDVRGEDVSVWGAREFEHNILTCNMRVAQIS